MVAKPGEQDGPNVAIDVTTIVQGWNNGLANRGIVLEGVEENLTAFTEKACVTAYLPTSLKLEVAYR